MRADLILGKLIEMAGGPSERGYVLALTADGFLNLPAELSTASGTYAVVRPKSEIGLRHILWKADGAPVLALLDEPLARRLPPDLVRRAKGHRVHSVEAAEVLGLALGVPVVASDNSDVERLAMEHVDHIRALLGERTLPTVVDRDLLDELLLEVVLGKEVRKGRPGDLLAAWLRSPPDWSPSVLDLVRRQLPRMHGLEGQLLAWTTRDPKGPETMLVHGVLLATEEAELPQAAWGALWEAPKSLGLTLDTFRQTAAGLARQTLDALGTDAVPLLERAGSVANRVLTPGVIAKNRDLPLGLDNLCHAVAGQIAAGEAIEHGTIQAMQQHRFASARAAEIGVLEQMARLSRYLATPPLPEGTAVVGRVRAYQRGGAFADWAATRLRAALAKSVRYRKQAEAVQARYRTRRDEENRAFAGLFQKDYEGALHAPGCVPLHRIWTHPPIRPEGADIGPLFLVVLDGCSYPVFLQLLSEVAAEIQPLGLRVSREGEAHGIPALAPLPTVTSHARSAIFLGTIPKDPWLAETVWRDQKEAATDPARFKQNEALGQRSRRLFLKGDLADHGESLLAALKDASIDVVAVVLNAVDDQIGSSNTGAVVTVRAEEITSFLPSLREAFRAGRRVVWVADHGHTSFLGKEHRTGDGSTPRYRLLGATESAPEGFLEIDDHGLGGVAGRKAFAWKMGAYQGLPQVGFHGGCSLEEMVVPLAEIVQGGVGADEPGWWYGGNNTSAKSATAMPAAPPVPVVPAPAPVPPPKKPLQGQLFDRAPLFAGDLDRIGLPAPLRDKLDASEQAALVCVFLNQHARVSDIAEKLSRPRARVPGLMSKLITKLHAANFPCLRRTSLPDHEEQYTYVRQGTER